ncbi:MAG: exported protein of unknown function, putative Peptidase [Nitrospira sp.]|nr:exported protein of unknown function, putative Peptidase [Nitrospira sp.]
MILACYCTLGHKRHIDHAGTVSAIDIANAPTGADDPSAGAVMTGTIEKEENIGPVGATPDKIRAAARKDYRTVLMSVDQPFKPSWTIGRLAWKSQRRN